MEIKVTRHGDVPVFRLKGRLSVVGADDLEKQIVQSIDAGAKRLLFVLDDLEYISSAGLRVFYVGIKKLNNDGSCFWFCGLKPAVRSIFDVVGLTPSVRVYATEQEALGQIGAASK